MQIASSTVQWPINVYKKEGARFNDAAEFSDGVCAEFLLAGKWWKLFANLLSNPAFLQRITRTGFWKWHLFLICRWWGENKVCQNITPGAMGWASSVIFDFLLNQTQSIIRFMITNLSETNRKCVGRDLSIHNCYRKQLALIWNLLINGFSGRNLITLYIFMSQVISMLSIGEDFSSQTIGTQSAHERDDMLNSFEPNPLRFLAQLSDLPILASRVARPRTSWPLERGWLTRAATGGGRYKGYRQG